MPNFQDVALTAQSMEKPTGLPEPWTSPYRLLGGAAFSIGLAHQFLSGPNPGSVAIPDDWWSTLEHHATQNQLTLGKATPPWLRIWGASYMLTNAIFRIAAAVEKTCYLVGQLPENTRKQLWKAIHDNQSLLSKRLPTARKALRQMPGPHAARNQYLQRSRQGFQQTRKLRYPLLHAIIQTDIDKHVAYKPAKELQYERTLATNAFIQATHIWNEAVGYHRTTQSTA